MTKRLVILRTISFRKVIKHVIFGIILGDFNFKPPKNFVLKSERTPKSRALTIIHVNKPEHKQDKVHQ